MSTGLFKIIFVAAWVVAGAVLIVSTPARATYDDPAAFYNKTCKACHGAAAEKKFDRSLADDALVQIILDGKKAEKPPNMPAYKDKGVTAEQAKALVDYMRTLK